MFFILPAQFEKQGTFDLSLKPQYCLYNIMNYLHNLRTGLYYLL